MGDERRAVIAVVEQENRVASARFPVRHEKCTHAAEQDTDRRQRVGRSTRRADRRAISAAGADIGVDLDMIARGRDRLHGADIEATGAAGNLRAGMRAEIRLEGDVARLVELADEFARRLHCSVDLVRQRFEIAVACLMRGKQRRAGGKIEDQVAARQRTVALGERSGRPLAVRGNCRARRHRRRNDPRPGPRGPSPPETADPQGRRRGFRDREGR